MTDAMQRVSDKLERAIRNSTKLHVTLDEALAIYASEAGRQLVLLAREETLDERGLEANPRAAEASSLSPPLPFRSGSPLSNQ